MFRTLAQALRPGGPFPPTDPAPGDPVFRRHPLELSRYLEDQWASASTAAWTYPKGGLPSLGPPLPVAAGALLSLPPALASTLSPGFRVVSSAGLPLPWEHAIYAYLVESTGVMEILGEVVRRFVIGETLESPDPETQAWVRNTEELFFRDPPQFAVTAVTSQLRPQAKLNRRNLYWRLFGLDLPPVAGASSAETWKQQTGAINDKFRRTWVDLLQQIWLGVTNARNSAGANPTDPNYVAYLCRTLADMAELRRRGGLLAREEFVYVSTLNWFHLTVATDTPVVKSLRAETESGSPADRLRRIGERVGMTPSPASRELFELADQVAVILRLIDRRIFDAADDARLLFDTSIIGNPLPSAMTEIVNRWQSATGDPVKELAVRATTVPSAARPVVQPVRLPEPTATPTTALTTAAATNGSR
jgi:hypothetical protein